MKKFEAGKTYNKDGYKVKILSRDRRGAYVYFDDAVHYDDPENTYRIGIRSQNGVEYVEASDHWTKITADDEWKDPCPWVC